MEIKEILQMLEAMASNDDIAFLPRQASLLLDYITNLQQKEELFEKIVYKYDELKRENKRLKELDENYPIEEELAEAYRREEDYKSRIEKAVEYLDSHKMKLSHSFDEPDCDYWIATNPQDIIDILNGRSDK